MGKLNLIQSQSKREITISVVIPAYNAEHYISRALDSVLDQSEPPEEDHMANAREASFRSWEVGLEENSYWRNTLQFYISRGMDPTRILINPSDVLENVTGEDIMGAARKYLNRDRYVRVTLYPEDTDS